MINVFSQAGRVQIYQSYAYNVVMESVWELVALICGTAILGPVYAAWKSGSLLEPVHATMAQVCVAFYALALFGALYKVARAAQHFFREKRRNLEP